MISRTVALMLGDKLHPRAASNNPSTGAVGLRAAGADAPGAFQLRPQSKGPGRMIGGKRSFKHHGLDAGQARTYEAKHFGNGAVGFLLAPKDSPAPADVAPESFQGRWEVHTIAPLGHHDGSATPAPTKASQSSAAARYASCAASAPFPG